MTPNTHVSKKAGLNREILDTAPALLMPLRRYKGLETGGLWVEVPTKRLKPSQTCPECGQVRKKTLSERTHRCEPCGHTEPRDITSARGLELGAARNTDSTSITSGTDDARVCALRNAIAIALRLG